MKIDNVRVGRRLFTNIGLNFTAQAILLMLNFATAPYIVHTLGAKSFAIVALVQTVASFAAVLNLGIGRALTKYVSELYWNGETDRIKQFFQTAWTTCFLAGLAGVLLLVVPSGEIERIFFREARDVDSELVTFAIYVAAFGLFSSMLLETTAAIPIAAQRFGILNAIQLLTGTMWALGSVAILAAGYSIRSVLFLNLLSNVTGVVAFALASRRIVPGLNFSLGLNRDALRKLFSFATPLMVSAVAALIITRFDRFILVYYLPLAAITFYSLPYTLSEKLSIAVANVTSVVFPFASELHAMEAHDKVHELYVRSTRALTLMTLPITVILLTIPGPILKYWLGTDATPSKAGCLLLRYSRWPGS